MVWEGLNEEQVKMIKMARLLLIPWLILLAGCTRTINLDKTGSDEMAANFKQHAYHLKFQVECSHALSNYVYQGYPSGLTGSEVKSSINIGETFCALLDQAEEMVPVVSGENKKISLDLKSITFTYSYKGMSLWAEDGRDFDVVFILIKLVVDSGSRSREYTFISEKEQLNSKVNSSSANYAIVNNALEDIIYQLYGKLYQDFV